MIKPSFFAYWLELNLKDKGHEIHLKLASQMALIANAAAEGDKYTANRLFSETQTTKRELQYAIGGFRALTRDIIKAVVARREFLFLNDLKTVVISLVDLYLSNEEKKTLLNDFKKAHELEQLAMPIKQAEPVMRCIGIPLQAEGEIQAILSAEQAEDTTGFGNLNVTMNLVEDENDAFKKSRSIFTAKWMLHAPAIQHLTDKEKVTAEYIKSLYVE